MNRTNACATKSQEEPLANRHGCDQSSGPRKVIVLVGSPNVGKSVIFGNLTGSYAVVSNYPGTTVEVTKGKSKFGCGEYQIVDTPGMYSLLPITEEERVARAILLDERPDVVLQVADAKNIERTLHITLQLAEAGLPVLLDLNLMDEAKEAGLFIDAPALQAALGVPVVETVATKGFGMDVLKEQIARYEKRHVETVHYAPEIESAIREMQGVLEGDFNVSTRTIALLLLQEDSEIADRVRERVGIYYRSIEEAVERTKRAYDQPLAYAITLARQAHVRRLIDATTTMHRTAGMEFRDTLSRLMMHPLAGIPILLAVIYGFYEFVGVFGAQKAVAFLEEDIFGGYINPVVTKWVSAAIPWTAVQDLLVHDYGVITLGLRYAVAIILPLVSTFFLAFSILEDTGYLPRLAMFLDRLFKTIGLSGRAVIPMVLGFGCDTMATIVTRTLETRRERVIATFLLSLAVPCSAQMGVILALLAGNPKGLGIFVGVMSVNFLFIGYLTAKVMPGDRPLFYMDVPPLRWPKLSNVLTKTYTRVEWYLKEVLPLFVFASVLIWAGKLTGLFDALTNLLSYPVGWIGLPKEAAPAFLFDFFRRDYGAAGLYDLKQAGLLHGTSLIVSVVTLALFMPCIAQLSIIIKERGIKTALAMAGFISVYAFFMGWLANSTINAIGIVL